MTLRGNEKGASETDSIRVVPAIAGNVLLLLATVSSVAAWARPGLVDAAIGYYPREALRAAGFLLFWAVPLAIIVAIAHWITTPKEIRKALGWRRFWFT